ncbi:hypothetical protein H6762_03715 [Candidatus Nomurabacteria bacterium]|uniref:Uncharacterized protein n=1 Tax=Candidatus Dojkabacteria bacterium TaxID=2099670 RepID=A0A955I1M5_9BACT|nr:hypothetical protein [Candidatus Dojkabacteria bacterium]MCB9790068.1 hypothetical protein [Candidatus Nomurabacteria bacterium]
MNLSKKELTILYALTFILVSGFVVISILFYIDMRETEKVIMKPPTGIEYPEKEDTCGNMICEEGDRNECPTDCTTGIIQANDSKQIVLNDTSPKLRQSFTAVGVNPSLRYIRLQYVDLIRKPVSLRIYDGTELTTPLLELSFVMPNDRARDYQIFEGDDVEIPFVTGQRYVLELEVSAGGETTFYTSQDSSIYPYGELEIFGLAKDKDGNVIDDQERWIEQIGDLQFTILLWSDDQTEDLGRVSD